jgi:cell fate (sporulation/competence/biofilm development) regulator YmcA (YheA/YmcA/DUF963 family)
MIFSAIKLVTKAATIITVAQTSYKAYQKGKVVYKAYKKSKEVKSVANNMIKEIKKVIKK